MIDKVSTMVYSKINVVYKTQNKDYKQYLFKIIQIKKGVIMKKAFTLAEVLITLAIIGVVAAITIPSLIQKHNERVTVTKLKKMHSVLNNALRLSVVQHGEINQWGLSATGEIELPEDTPQEEIDARRNMAKFMRERIRENLKVIDVCDDIETGCGIFVKRYTLDGQEYSHWGSRIVLADGSVIYGATIISADCTRSNGDSKLLQNICGQIFVDVNGIKEPNTQGKDVFLFYYSKDGSVIPIGSKDDTGVPFPRYCNRKTGHRVTNGYGCTAWVIENENMDYLHCDDLSWDGKHKCSDK